MCKVLVLLALSTLRVATGPAMVPAGVAGMAGTLASVAPWLATVAPPLVFALQAPAPAVTGDR